MPACLHQLTPEKNAHETAHPAIALMPFLSMDLAAHLMALHDPCRLSVYSVQKCGTAGNTAKGTVLLGQREDCIYQTCFFFSSVPCLNLPTVHLQETEENVSILILT